MRRFFQSSHPWLKIQYERMRRQVANYERAQDFNESKCHKAGRINDLEERLKKDD